MQPGCSPPPAVTQDDDRQPRGGEERAGSWPLPWPQLQGCSSSVLGRRVRRVGSRLPWAAACFFPQCSGEKGVRRPRRCQLPRVWLPGLGGSGAASGAASYRFAERRCPSAAWVSVAQHVVRREGGVRVLGQSRPCSCGEDGSEDLPVRTEAAAIRRCGVGAQVATIVGAEVVVAIGEAVSTDETVSATCGRISGSLALMAYPRPSCGGWGRGPFHSSVCPEAIAAAV
jgi:hypothetical protein